MRAGWTALGLHRRTPGTQQHWNGQGYDGFRRRVFGPGGSRRPLARSLRSRRDGHHLEWWRTLQHWQGQEHDGTHRRAFGLEGTRRHPRCPADSHLSERRGWHSEVGCRLRVSVGRSASDRWSTGCLDVGLKFVEVLRLRRGPTYKDEWQRPVRGQHTTVPVCWVRRAGPQRGGHAKWTAPHGGRRQGQRRQRPGRCGRGGRYRGRSR